MFSRISPRLGWMATFGSVAVVGLDRWRYNVMKRQIFAAADARLEENWNRVLNRIKEMEIELRETTREMGNELTNEKKLELELRLIETEWVYLKLLEELRKP